MDDGGSIMTVQVLVPLRITHRNLNTNIYKTTVMPVFIRVGNSVYLCTGRNVLQDRAPGMMTFVNCKVRSSKVRYKIKSWHAYVSSL